MTDSDASRAIAGLVRRSGSSFFWAMRLLARDKREGLFAIYALCRELDDIADEPADDADKRARLDAWRRELDAVYRGMPTTPLGRGLLGPVRRFGLPRDEFEALVAGMEMDVGQGLRAPPLDQLRLYCRRVAGAVGLLALPVFGSTGEQSRRFALDLGDALQLTNILRDVAEDAAMGRLYLPREILDEAGIGDSDPTRVVAHPRLALARAGLARLAERRFADAKEALAQVPDRGALRPALVMMAVYRALFHRLMQRGWAEIEPRLLRLSAAEKFGIALRCQVLGR